MASQINPNPIDDEYPVAGQDNNTQGFRSNFSQIKLNFQYAKNEITSLQETAVFTGASVVNNLAGSTLYDVRLQNNKFATAALGNVGNVVTINYAAGPFQSLTTTENTSLAFDTSKLPTSGNTAVFTLSVNATAASSTSTPYTISIANASTSSSGIIGLSGNVLTFPRTNSTNAGTHTYQLITSDQGGTFTITPLSTPTQPLNATSEDLASAANVNLGVSDSYFSTGGAETATLPAGVNGQVKVLAMLADGGDMVITVTNAGWKSSGTGTITFDTIGDACTLKYINSKWFCIGNNGCVFA